MALLAGHVVVLLVSPNPPILQDYPDWVYQGVLFAKTLARHPVPGYALKHYPVPNSLTTIGVGVLTLLVGWQLAAKLWLVLVVLAAGVACVRLIRALSGEHDVVLPVFAASVIAGLDLWNGSINFQLSLGFLLLLLAHLLKPRASDLGTALLLLLCFFTHMLPCGAGLLALGALAMQERNAKRLLPAVPTVVCVVWYALARDPDPAKQPASHLLPALLALGGVFFWAMKASAREQGAAPRPRLVSLVWPVALPSLAMLGFSKLLQLLGWLGPLNVLTAGTGVNLVLWPAAPFWIFSLVGLAAAGLGVWRLGTTWVGLCRSQDPRRFLAVTSVGLFALFLFSPADALGVTPIDGRFLRLAVATGLGLLSLVPRRRVTLLASLAVVVGCINLAEFAAVQFRPYTVSVPLDQHLSLGVSPVAPALRAPYYDALRAGHYRQWIFPTAMFRRVP